MIPRTDRPAFRFHIENLLRSNKFSTVIAIHFKLFDIIKSNYKLREHPGYLEKAIDACQASICISDLVLSAFDADEKQRVDFVNLYITHKKHPITLLRPRHIGYQQYSIVLKKQKNLSLRSEVLSKHDIEGWGQGVITVENKNK